MSKDKNIIVDHVLPQEDPIKLALLSHLDLRPIDYIVRQRGKTIWGGLRIYSVKDGKRYEEDIAYIVRTEDQGYLKDELDDTPCEDCNFKGKKEDGMYGEINGGKHWTIYEFIDN